MVEFKYEIAGAYYPAPNAELPADARPAENFIRFYEIKSNQVCTTGLPSVALNLHPTRPVRVAYTDANANPAKPVVIIIPRWAATLLVAPTCGPSSSTSRSISPNRPGRAERQPTGSGEVALI